jgi:23S rRNA (pseudouridine1915-N3)-methyltransferase
MPDWITAGWHDYAGRLPRECRLELIEIPLARRGRNPDLNRLRRQEGERLLAACPDGACLLALDVEGRQWSTAELAEQLAGWLADGRDLVLAVGGPDGLDPVVAARAEGRWSLSRLTLPHPLVRVLVAEQLYRAWSLLNNHPYHRA